MLVDSKGHAFIVTVKAHDFTTVLHKIKEALKQSLSAIRYERYLADEETVSFLVDTSLNEKELRLRLADFAVLDCEAFGAQSSWLSAILVTTALFCLLLNCM